MKRTPRLIRHWFRRPIVEFFETGASGGIVLIAATVAALVWANSAAEHAYHDLWHTKLSLGWGEHKLALSLHHWINDGLMAVFFFFVGLEIKREVLTGELATWRQASLPAMGAVGGMVVPAVFYLLFNRGGEGLSGWGVPMATDIAFAIGVLMLLGKRVPLGLKVFLTALAVVDDLGAVLVIAIFYTAQLDWVALGWGVGILIMLAVVGRAGGRKTWIFAVLGVLVWYCFLRSGVHATVAGVLVALTVPHGVLRERPEFLSLLDRITDEMWDRDRRDESVTEEHHIAALEKIQQLASDAGSPLQHLEHSLARPVAYVIMPLFALANAGVGINAASLGQAFSSPIPLGILAGLILGKQIGIFGFSWAAVKMGWASLPRGVNWRSLHGAAALGGIGFTMSLFIANLAFSSEEALIEAKMGILIASLAAAISGTALLLGPGASPEDSPTETGVDSRED